MLVPPVTDLCPSCPGASSTSTVFVHTAAELDVFVCGSCHAYRCRQPRCQECAQLNERLASPCLTAPPAQPTPFTMPAQAAGFDAELEAAFAQPSAVPPGEMDCALCRQPGAEHPAAGAAGCLGALATALSRTQLELKAHSTELWAMRTAGARPPR